MLEVMGGPKGGWVAATPTLLRLAVYSFMSQESQIRYVY